MLFCFDNCISEIAIVIFYNVVYIYIFIYTCISAKINVFFSIKLFTIPPNGNLFHCLSATEQKIVHKKDRLRVT